MDCRLTVLVSLPQMVAGSTMDAESIGLVKDYVNELLWYVPAFLRLVLHELADDGHSFLVTERDRLFLTEYQSASLQYQNISRS